MRLELNDTRRLTGPNLFWDHASAIIEVGIDEVPANEVVRCWRTRVRELLDAVGWTGVEIRHRVYEGGASLLFSAPIDALYAACEINEAAWSRVVAEFSAEETVCEERHDDAEQVEQLRQLIAEERNPALLAMHVAAARYGKPFLWDDDEVSIGYGADALVWPAKSVPSPETVDWKKVSGIPLALVTGTNGKSTTVRLAASILAAAGKCAGITSTDYIRVGQDILDHGDYSGPGGARTLLRDSRSEAVVLEVARGGMLRRGLGVEHADAALVTNVAADHLGEYGIDTVADMVETKFVIRRALGPDSPLVLNADDPGCLARGMTLEQEIVWFTLDHQHATVTRHVADGGMAWMLSDGWLVRTGRELQARVVATGEIPVTMGGAARYNIQNCLGAAALCHAMGIGDEAIRDGLMAFRGDPEDNPGRGNLFEKNGVRILVDFAHNEHGMIAIADTVRAMKGERRVVLMGQAGDRLDQDIDDLVRAAVALHPDRLLACELPGYERGRETGVIPQIIRSSAIDAGVPASRIEIFPCPIEGAHSALDAARPGDVLVLLALTQREEVLQLIREYVQS